jgi:uncharacterized tellurite resistance protein B-like protein
VIGAAVAGGSACYGVSYLCRSYSGSRVMEVPNFLNTPLDVLGASMLDLLGALSMKVAAIDGMINTRDKQAICDYFIDDWGFDPSYVSNALIILEENIEKSRLAEMTAALAEFAHSSPDCNFAAIQKEVKSLLVGIAEADGTVDDREEMAIKRIITSMDEQNSIASSLSRAASSSASAATSAASSAKTWLFVKLLLGKGTDAVN